MADVAWPVQIPAYDNDIVVFDVETTGIGPYDRIITLGAFRLTGYELIPSDPLYLIFDPKKNSHEDAIKIHGWDNWTIRFQEPFENYAEKIYSSFGRAKLLISHNIAFDMPKLNRELRKAGMSEISVPTHCTMQTARERWGGGSLDYCIGRVGLCRSGARHGALEDAWLTAMLYRSMHHGFVPITPPIWSPPINLRPASPPPEGELPRRGMPSTAEGKLISERVTAVTEAVAILRWLGRVGDTESSSREAIVDDFIRVAAEAAGIPARPENLQRLRVPSDKLKGTPARADRAIEVVARDPDLLALLAPRIIDMLQSDGYIGEEERTAARHFLARARAIRGET